VNRQTTYRLEALVELAHAHPESVPVAELAARRRIPRAFLARLLTELARTGVVVTQRGPAGGVALARPPAGVSVAAILPGEGAPAAGGPAVQRVAAALEEARRQALTPLTLAALAEEERRAESIADFSI
jgi:DNA-binding IscR family transcriptional regulator